MPPLLILRFGDLTIDLERYRVLLGDRPVVLAYRDYALLVYLASRAGQVVHKRQLLEEGLGRHDPGGLRAVDEHMRHLKHMLEWDGRLFIQEIEGRGYRFARPPGPTVTGAGAGGDHEKRAGESSGQPRQ